MIRRCRRPGGVRVPGYQHRTPRRGPL